MLEVGAASGTAVSATSGSGRGVDAAGDVNEYGKKPFEKYTTPKMANTM